MKYLAIRVISASLKSGPKVLQQFAQAVQSISWKTSSWISCAILSKFLGGDNLCSIYDVRPKACREFPHTDRKKIYQINHLTIKNTLTCPAAYLFVEKLKDRL